MGKISKFLKPQKLSGHTKVTLALIGCVLLINGLLAVTPDKYKELDMSKDNLYEISDITHEILDGLNTKIDLYSVYPEAETDRRILKFCETYADASDMVDFQIVNTAENPTFLKEHNIDAQCVLVRCEETGRQEAIPFTDIVTYDESYYYMYGEVKEQGFDGDGQITSAITRVTSGEMETIYRLTGHTEAAPGGTATSLLNKNNLELKTLDLLKEDIPDNCRLLLIYAPETDIADVERKMIEDYLDAGGKVMIVLAWQYGALPNLEAILDGYGINLQDGYATDVDNTYNNDLYYLFAQMQYGNPITKSFVEAKKEVMLIYTKGFLLDEDTDELDTDQFLYTSENGYLVNADDYTKGQYVLAATAVKKDAGTMVAFGSEYIASDDLINAYARLANADVFLSAVNWELGSIENIAIPAKNIEMQFNTVQRAALKSTPFVIGIPALIILAGFLVWIRRRKL